MPWLSIFLALLAFFSQKSAGASNTKALLTAGLVGAGSYYVTHETDWGKANLGVLDGVDAPGTGAARKDESGTPLLDTSGGAVKQVIGGTFDTLRSWGGAGTSAVIGASAAAAGGIFSSSNLPWLLAAGALLLVLK